MQSSQPVLTATRIREARTFTGLSQERFAALVGTSRRHLIRWEGAKCRPSSRSIGLIARAAGVSPEWLAGSAHESTSPVPSSARAQGSRSDNSASNGSLRLPSRREG